ncbi:MAG: LPS export ABC transporter permease LptF [Gammaproteobacteria bacterium]|nr:LPS export ABC transporter permease LptF [Gammaproteobacteria bacterium]MBU6510334.1 LPS export ABC transporter permease LptF [Gammaproteobacteria bacterium]MDE1984371.1 LPS export ABC transporter permease LptF [Gammaproteobacteria bacterium]MDE2108691.1 LPS export ABC transporter permease LptF [Gammaproteobacteria bacterium]
MSTVDRYLARETVLTWAAVTVILMLILLSNRFALLLGDAVAGRLPRDTVFALLGLASVSYFIVVVPVALFLAVMLALGRLYRDNEMTTLMACGVGPAQVYRPLLAVAAVLAVVLALLALQVAPWSARMSDLIRSYGQHNAQVGSFISGSFKQDQQGRGVLYAAGVSDGGRELRDVFMAGPSGDRQDVVSAASGTRVVNGEQGAGTLVLHNGYRYEGVPGQADFRVVQFGEYRIRLSPSAPAAGPEGFSEMPTSALLRNASPDALSEFQWRVSVPLSALLLVFLAVPLARTSPRQGRYGRLFIAILAYVIYFNLVGVARAWLQRGLLPASVGIWWVLVLLLIAALALLYHQYGWRGLWFRPMGEADARH